MGIYRNTGAALMNAFNASLFDSYKSSGWQDMASELCDKYPELGFAAFSNVDADTDGMTRYDWVAQAGMVAGLLREHLSQEDFHLLRARYTHDGNIIDSAMPGMRITDNLQAALLEGWPYIRSMLLQSGEIRQTVCSNPLRLQYYALRAIRPDVIGDAVQAEGSEKQATVNRQQYEVRKVVNQQLKLALKSAGAGLESAGMVG